MVTSENLDMGTLAIVTSFFAGSRVTSVPDKDVTCGCRVRGSKCRVQGAGCRVQGSGFKVQGCPETGIT